MSVDEKIEFLKHYRLAPGGSLLDVGCGGGGYLLAAKALGLRATGVEPSESHSRIARQLGLEVIPGYFSAQALPHQAFDTVLASHVIEHILEPAVFVRQMLDVLRPGGLLILVTPNAESIARLLTLDYWSMLKPIDHVSMIGPSAIPHIAPRDIRVSWRTTEYKGEILTSCLVSFRDLYRERLFGIQTDSNVSGPSENHRPKPKSRVVRDRAIEIFSAPLHSVAKRLQREACLVIELRKD